MKRQFLSILTAFMLAAAHVPPLPVRAADDEKQEELEGGFFYECRNRDYAGMFDANVDPDDIRIQWSGVRESVFRYGTEQEKNRSVSMLDALDIRYLMDFKGRGTYYFGISVHTEDPACAFYVIEGWNAWEPPGNDGVLKTAEINGVQYDLFMTQKNAGKEPDSVQYPVFWSVRHESFFPNDQYGIFEGYVSLADHFRAWDSLDSAEILNGTLQQIGYELYAADPDQNDNAWGSCRIQRLLNYQMVPWLRAVVSDDAEESDPQRDVTQVSERSQCTGDANCDGTVDVADAVLIMRYAVEDREAVITDQGKLNSDTDGDGNVSAEDAKRILLFVAKKIGAFDASNSSASNEQRDLL